jgi:two-component system, cell cycle sensor histidine kinase and response regulator CckA
MSGSFNDANDGLSPDILRAQRTRRLESLIGMAMGVAHDLNNSMACVLGNNGILKRRIAAGATEAENVQQIEESAMMTVEMAKELTLFAGRVRINKTILDLAAVLRDMEDELRAMVGEGVELRIQSSIDQPPLQADAGQVRAVIGNLVSNAVDFLVNRTGVVTVRTDWLECGRDELARCYFSDNMAEGPYAVVEVSDTGRGMSSHVLERIFDPFFSTKMRGHGMGLSVVIGIVRAHRGGIVVQSEPDRGALFRVLLPCIA